MEVGMKIKIITNNSKVKSKFSKDWDVDYLDSNYKDVLIKARDYVHKGYKLLTHPLSGSVKPNETPYKTILVSKIKESLDYQSLSIIEKSIETAEKFHISSKDISEEILEDFKEIDLSLIENVINKL
jgi:hypothetical protein